MRGLQTGALTLIFALAGAGAAHAIAPTPVAPIPASAQRKGPDQGMTSATHKKFVGQIVFTTKQVPLKPKASIFRKTFKGSDTIYGRVFVSRSLDNTPVYLGGKASLPRRARWRVHAFVDGVHQPIRFGAFFELGFKGSSNSQWTTWRFEPRPKALDNDTAYPGIVKGFNKIVANMAPGKHKVHFEVWAVEGQFRSKTPIAAGGFTYVRGANDKLVAGKLPKSGLSGGARAAVVKQMRAALLSRRIAKSSGEILKIVPARYFTGRFTDTGVRYRKIMGTVLWKSKKGGPLCKFVSYNFLQTKRGAGWTRLGFKSFCNGCPEGEARCK